jgi:hypothetical protein
LIEKRKNFSQNFCKRRKISTRMNIFVITNENDNFLPKKKEFHSLPSIRTNDLNKQKKTLFSFSFRLSFKFVLE